MLTRNGFKLTGLFLSAIAVIKHFELIADNKPITLINTKLNKNAKSFKLSPSSSILEIADESSVRLFAF